MPTFIFFRNGEPDEERMKGVPSKKEILDFMDRLINVAMPVPEFDDSYVDIILNGDSPTVILFRTYLDSNETFVKEFDKFAKEFENEDIIFIVSSIYQGMQKVLGEYAGIEQDEDMPTIVVLNFTDDMYKYRYPGDVRKAKHDDMVDFLI